MVESCSDERIEKLDSIAQCPLLTPEQGTKKTEISDMRLATTCHTLSPKAKAFSIDALLSDKRSSTMESIKVMYLDSDLH